MLVFNGRMASVHLSLDEFCAIAKRVCDEMPTQFRSYMKNIVVDVRLRPTRRQLRGVGLDPNEGDLLGLFEGVPVTEQHDEFAHPNRVWVFKHPIEAICRSADEVAYEIRRTIIHELAHHFGWSEEDLEEFESQPNPFDGPEDEPTDGEK
jgi:predicted Zn-dependent protease with MMP-like domain